MRDYSDTRARAVPCIECCIIYSSFAYSGRYLFTDWNSTKPYSKPLPLLRGV